MQSSLNEDDELNNVICPYCGYRLPLKYGKSAKVFGVSIRCKGRNCRREFMLKIDKGKQLNILPDNQTVEAFKQVFGEEFKEHIFNSFGVML